MRRIRRAKSNRSARDLWRDHVRALLSAPGCPLCTQAAENERRWLFWFLAERCAEGETFTLLHARGGFCSTHAATLRQSKAFYVLTALGAEEVRRVLADLRSMRERLTGRKRKDSDGLLINRGCLMCAELGQTIRNTATIFGRNLIDPDHWKRYIEHPHGLCLAHFSLTVPTAPPAILPDLVVHQQARLASVARELDQALKRHGEAPGGDRVELEKSVELSQAANHWSRAAVSAGRSE